MNYLFIYDTIIVTESLDHTIESYVDSPKKKAAALWLKTWHFIVTIDYMPQCLNNNPKGKFSTYLIFELTHNENYLLQFQK